MSRTRSCARNLLAAAAVGLLVSACVVAPAPRGYYARGFVAVAPPAPRVELYGAAPYPGWFWVGGYWGWTGYRYTWVRGHWQAPRPGYRWVRQRWVHRRGGWRFREGHWARR